VSTWLIIAICIFVIGWIYLLWEIYKAPIMPDDYGLTEEDMWPGEEVDGKEDNK